jgi:long-chain acyl-CoA synthetase
MMPRMEEIIVSDVAPSLEGRGSGGGSKRTTSESPHTSPTPSPPPSRERETASASGLEGEIRMKGPNIMKGYFKLPEQTAAAFDENGYFRTGDMGRFDADGHLYITGRIKEMLIIGGENVFPREIEEVLDKHPSVAASAVIGVMDESRGEVPVAFVELKEGEKFDETALRKFCREHLAQFKVPRDIRSIEKLPRNPTGKIMRRELKGMVS